MTKMSGGLEGENSSNGRLVTYKGIYQISEHTEKNGSQVSHLQKNELYIWKARKL